MGYGGNPLFVYIAEPNTRNEVLSLVERFMKYPPARVLNLKKRILRVAAGLIALVLCANLVGFTGEKNSWQRAKDGKKLSFNRDVQPILAQHCFHCHGPDKGSRKADLRLDIPGHVFDKDSKTGLAPIVKGNPDESEIVKRMTSHDPDEIMPPPDAPEKPVSPEQVTIIKEWIKQGAEYQPHWAFIPPVKPTVPGVSDPSWPKNDIDRFVMARLDEEGLKPNPEADRTTLIRRVTLDLTGLLPTPEEVDAFVSDQSPNAYEKVVDRLLASPRYGEHRARYWLDVARYGDTHGLHYDRFRSIWPYRDYVVKAFNENKPFNQFVREQVAGDMLPAENLDQLIATGFNRTHISTGEGGTIIEELRVNTRRERVEGIGAAFLGLTLQCAVCHDHKFDPISQKDFYQLAATFGNITDKGSNDDRMDPPPILRVPEDPAKQAEANAILKEKAGVERAMAARRAPEDEEVRKWLAQPNVVQAVSTKGLVARFPFDEGKGKTVHNVVTGKGYELEGPDPAWNEDVLFWPTFRFEANTKLAAQDLGDFEGNQPFSVSGWFRVPTIPLEFGVSKTGAFISRMDPAVGKVAARGENPPARGWDLFYKQGAVKSAAKEVRTRNAEVRAAPGEMKVDLIGDSPEQSIQVASKDIVMPRGEWAQVAFSYDGSGKAAGVKIYFNGKEIPTKVINDNLQGSIRSTSPLYLGRRPDSDPLQELSFQDVRLYERVLTAEEVERLSGEDLIAEALLKKPVDQWTPDEKKMAADFKYNRLDPEFQKLKAQEDELNKKLAEVTKDGVVTLISTEDEGMPLGHVLDRGAYTARAERVYANVPEVLPPWPKGAPHNRLGFAEWLTMPDQPLVPRVVTNRFWQEVFGMGIVETPDDFGIVGDRPVNPDLLDWLAVDFRDSGGDVKRFFKEMVMSATYRQSAKVTPELLELDPKNRLLARGPRFRMDGEMVRDTALEASGLLVEKVGGPPVKPYIPQSAMEGDYNKVDTGEGLYRRSLYSFWKRMAPLPNMDTFDAPSREVACPRRQRTNTPLQALVVMNDPQFVEASRVMAQKLLQEGPTDSAGRMNWISSRLLSRTLKPEEQAILEKSRESLEKIYAGDPALAKKIQTVGASPQVDNLPPDQVAVWALMASQIMNLDENLNK